MADGGDRLVGPGEVTDEGNGLFLKPQGVGVDHTTGQDEAVVVIGADLAEGLVHADLLALVVVLETLDLAAFGGDDVNIGPGRTHGIDRPVQLDLFEAVGSENGDGFSGKGGHERLRVWGR